MFGDIATQVVSAVREADKNRVDPIFRQARNCLRPLCRLTLQLIRGSN